MTSRQRRIKVDATSWRRTDVGTTLYHGFVPSETMLEVKNWYMAGWYSRDVAHNINPYICFLTRPNGQTFEIE